jgi:hypothetical protein
MFGNVLLAFENLAALIAAVLVGGHGAPPACLAPANYRAPHFDSKRADSATAQNLHVML